MVKTSSGGQQPTWSLPAGDSRCFATLVLLAEAVVAGYVLLALRVPQLFPPCPFYSVTHLYCPGCGTARAIMLLAHGEFCAALRQNPLLPAGVVALCLMNFNYLFIITTGREFRSTGRKRYPAVGWLLFGGILCYWLLRNVPAYPFTLLAPQ